MKKRIGVWLDRRKAIIVTLGENGETMQVVHSSLEAHGHPAVGTGAQDIVDEDSVQRQSSVQLKKYYEDIVSNIKAADYIMLMGPGEARVELRNNLERRMMGEKVLAVEPAEKMTDREVAAKIRTFFASF